MHCSSKRDVVSIKLFIGIGFSCEQVVVGKKITEYFELGQKNSFENIQL